MGTSGYKPVDPSLYTEDGMFSGYDNIVGIPIKLGVDPETMELFDELTQQLMEDSRVTLVDGGTEFLEYKQGKHSESKAAHSGTMVTVDKDGYLHPYDSRQQQLSSEDKETGMYNVEYDEDDIEMNDAEMEEEFA